MTQLTSMGPGFKTPLVKCGQAEKVKLTQMLTFCQAPADPADFEKCKTFTFLFCLWTYSHQCQCCMFWAEQYVAKSFVKRCYLRLLHWVATPWCRLTFSKSGSSRQALERRRLKAGAGKIPKYLQGVYITEHCQTVHWQRGQLMQILAMPRIPLWQKWKHIWSVHLLNTSFITTCSRHIFVKSTLKTKYETFP